MTIRKNNLGSVLVMCIVFVCSATTMSIFDGGTQKSHNNIHFISGSIILSPYYYGGTKYIVVFLYAF